MSLAKIYEEFCSVAWDEDADRELCLLAEDFEIDPIALGILASKLGDPDDIRSFELAAGGCDLQESALVAVTNGLRGEIFHCLTGVYGNEAQLYSRLWHTRSEEDDFEDEEFEPTGRNSAAFIYVTNRFLM